MKQIVLLNEQKAYILETHLTTRSQKIKQKCTTKWGKTSKIETHLTTRKCQMKQKCTTNNMLQNVKIQKSNFSSNHVYKVWKKNQPLMSQTHSRPLETQAVYHSSGRFCAKSCKPLVYPYTRVLESDILREEALEVIETYIMPQNTGIFPKTNLL